MEKTYRTKAITLRRVALGENDIRVTLYTRDNGKLELVARGTRKIKSKLAGHLESICLTNIMVVHGRQYDYIGAAISENCFSGIKSDLSKLLSVGQAVNIFNQLVKENHRDDDVFTLLKEFLETTNSQHISDTQSSLLSSFFIFKLLSLLGYKPELYNCVVCKNKIVPHGNSFDVKGGGLICGICSKKDNAHNLSEPRQLTISDECVKVLRLVNNSKFDVLKKLKVEYKLREEVKNIISSFHEFFS